MINNWPDRFTGRLLERDIDFALTPDCSTVSALLANRLWPLSVSASWRHRTKITVTRKSSFRTKESIFNICLQKLMRAPLSLQIQVIVMPTRGDIAVHCKARVLRLIDCRYHVINVRTCDFWKYSRSWLVFELLWTSHVTGMHISLALSNPWPQICSFVVFHIQFLQSNA